MEQIAGDPSVDLYGAIPHGDGYWARGKMNCPNLTFSENERSIADGKISLNVTRRVVSPACIAGVLISRPNFNTI